MARTRRTGISIPALPNHYPFNELLLNGSLSAKTRSWRWSHVGPTLLYTSRGTAQDVVQAHNLHRAAVTAPRGVLVGIGYLLRVRENTLDERRRIGREFLRRNVGPLFASGYRYEFRELRRFRKPIPFKPPQGAVRTFRVPFEVVATEFRRAGYRVSQLIDP